jgi:thiol-disulfide isomerase/thioredoxin
MSHVDRTIELFVMEGCAVCPQMERIFHDLYQAGEVDEFLVVDVGDAPDTAKRYNIRSVPHYLINGLAFTGLRSRREILELLHNDDSLKQEAWIREKLSAGELDPVESAVISEAATRHAVLSLLQDEDTELVVRIGLTAIIETLASRRIFDDLEVQFIALADHPEDRIAIDALYYLQLMATDAARDKLQATATKGRKSLRAQAQELLSETLEAPLLH